MERGMRLDAQIAVYLFWAIIAGLILTAVLSYQ